MSLHFHITSVVRLKCRPSVLPPPVLCVLTLRPLSLSLSLSLAVPSSTVRSSATPHHTLCTAAPELKQIGLASINMASVVKQAVAACVRNRE